MIRTRRTLTASTLLATLVLLPSLASARPAVAPRSHAAVHATRATSTDLLARLWHGLRNLWGQEGMTIDPNGAHLSGTTPGTTITTTKAAEGVLIDPNGAHLSGTTRQTPGATGTSDGGVLIDPNG